jgi:hypothetical protein
MWKKTKKWKAKTVTTPRLRFTVQPAHLSSFCLLVVFFFSALSPRVLPVADASPAPKTLKPTDPYALIFGTVWGPDDHPVYGITVKIRRLPSKRAKWQLYSDHSGEFAQRVAAGKADYVVSADLKGVKTTYGYPLRLAEEVPVHVEYDERVDIGLHLTRLTK